MLKHQKKQVVIGFLGSTLDTGKTIERWSKWRPTVAIFQQPDLLVDRLELIFQPPHTNTARLIIDDIEGISPSTEVREHCLPLDNPWDFEEVFAFLHDFAKAYPFDRENEDYLMHITTGSHVAQICMFLLTESRHFPARLLQTSPPSKREASPGTAQIIDLDLSRYDRLATRFAREQEDAANLLKAGIETHNRAFNALIDRIETVALRSRAPILLTGPTGVGKTMLARRIYELKAARRQVEGPLIELNCATLRGDGAMSTLFGHNKGAFTGAQSERPGLLRAAHEGVLFLDEIGELGLDEQAMLLGAIESKRFMPMGSDQQVTSDFQLIAGTNRDLPEEVRQGRFREDLLARIDLWTFTLPGLAARREDIGSNIDFELAQFARHTGTNVSFNGQARQRYEAFALSPRALWTANFRDLNASIARMATLAKSGRIVVDDVEQEITTLTSRWHMQGPDRSSAHLKAILGARIDDYDRFDLVQLADVLEVCKEAHSLSDAGRTLFAVSREQKKTKNDADRLRKYLAKFEIEWADLER